MNPLKSAELRVGFFVIIISVMIALLSMQSSEDPGFMGSSRLYKFKLDDASGLIVRSAVKVAGIDIGVIKKMTFVNGKALIEVSMRGDVKVTTSAAIEIRPNGILGDKYVEIIPGNPDDPLLSDGSEILIVNNRASMDVIMKEIGKITESISDVAESIKLAVKDGNEKSGPLARIIGNIDRLSADLAELSRGNKEKLNEIVSNVHEITETVNDIVNDEGDEGLRASWKRVASSISKIDRSMTNVEEITEKVNTGKGTIGRLINDEETVDKLNTTIDGVNNLVGGANKMTTAIDFHSTYLFEQSLAKSYIGMRLQPGLDRYYELAIVDDPKGVVERVDTTTTLNPGPGESTSKSREIKAFKNKIKFTALFAKNFYNFTVKGGLIESTGGLGFDIHFFQRSLRFSTDVYEFSSSPPHLRSYARYYFYKGIYMTGGADDILSRNGTYSSFVGAGIDLTNDDLKLLLSKSPF
jgi:phospholipid/cholesterol/gamma-HCH transport system substrate-binding protein